MWSFLFGRSQHSWKSSILYHWAFDFPWLTNKLSDFIVKYWTVELQQQKCISHRPESPRRWWQNVVSQEVLSKGHCSAGSNTEGSGGRNILRRATKFALFTDSHSAMYPGLEIYSILSSHLAIHMSESSCVTKRELWHHHPLSRELQPQRCLWPFEVHRLMQGSLSTLKAPLWLWPPGKGMMMSQ